MAKRIFFDVVTVGSATLDVFASAAANEIIIRENGEEEEFIAYESGTKILIKELDFFIGGGGTNTACSFSRLGLKTGFIGKLGNDENGKHILSMLKKSRVEFLGAIDKRHKSGYSIVLDSEDDRTILTHKGANDYLSYKDTRLDQIKTKWLYFASMTHKAYKTLEKMALFAKKNSIKLAFNPSSYIAKLGKEYLSKVIKRTNVLILNKEEASLILGKKGRLKSLLGSLSALGPEVVVITDGKNGCYAKHGSSYFYLPAKKTRVKDTTGAGDAFASGFIAGIIKGKGIEDSLKIGMANASSVITHVGAKNGLLSYSQAVARARKMRLAGFPHKA